MPTPIRRTFPQHLTEGLEDFLDQLTHADAARAARAALQVIDELPLLTSALSVRSAWLAYVRELVVELDDDCPDDVEVRLLVAIARTALAAHQTSPGLAAAEHALQRATENAYPAAQLAIRIGRLPYLLHRSPVEANRDLRTAEALFAQVLAAQGGVPDENLLYVNADLLLAKLAYQASTGDLSAIRTGVAQIARLQLPVRPALVYVAATSQSLVAQLWMRTGQWEYADQALSEALRLCESEGAWAEAANLWATRAALAALVGEVQRAWQAAAQAVQCAKSSTVVDAEPSPWLGVPYDVSVAKNPGAAVQLLAESVLTAQDLSDSAGFLFAAAAMAAFYLADNRALEALDALNEATQAAQSLPDPSVATALRRVAEAVLAHLGVFRA